jgi:hypothetical protein
MGQPQFFVHHWWPASYIFHPLHLVIILLQGLNICSSLIQYGCHNFTRYIFSYWIHFEMQVFILDSLPFKKIRFISET